MDLGGVDRLDGALGRDDVFLAVDVDEDEVAGPADVDVALVVRGRAATLVLRAGDVGGDAPGQGVGVGLGAGALE